MNPLKVYRALYNRFGPQGWWPLSGLDEEIKEDDADYQNYLKAVPSGTEAGFKRNWPRHLGVPPTTNAQRFEIVVGAILTQNTNWSNVEKALYNLNKKNLLDADAIAEAKITEIRKAVRPSGYYNQKALRLKKFAAYIQENYGGDLAEMFSQPTGALRHELLSLHGIGNETADSILLYAAGKPKFVVDAYTFRLNDRLQLSKAKTYAELQEVFEESLPKNVGLYKQFHALIVEQAKTHCRKTPECEDCPLEKKCAYRDSR